jgi:hypothetical protein
MGILYGEGGKIHCNDYMEIYIPMEYFANGVAINKGSVIETLGLVYIRAFNNGVEGPIQLLNLPTDVNFMVYEFKQETININNTPLDVMTLQYLKGAYVLHQTVPKGRDIANAFLDMMLAGKLPRTLEYTKVIDIWWRNLEISGISYKVPSKIFEMIIATIYRNPNNMKERYGQLYGNETNPDGYNYVTGNVRSVVKDLSTFSGMVFEDIGNMISNGINNSIENIDEPISPLEKIIHY